MPHHADGTSVDEGEKVTPAECECGAMARSLTKDW